MSFGLVGSSFFDPMAPWSGNCSLLGAPYPARGSSFSPSAPTSTSVGNSTTTPGLTKWESLQSVPFVGLEDLDDELDPLLDQLPDVARRTQKGSGQVTPPGYSDSSRLAPAAEDCVPVGRVRDSPTTPTLLSPGWWWTLPLQR